jgi:retinol dehydrogenase-12
MKRVLITGGTSGLGRAAAATLARQGFAVTLTGREEARCEAVAAALRQETASNSIEGLACDLTSLNAVREAARTFKERHSQLDVLILNAGTFLPKRELTPDGLEATLASRFTGHFLLVELLLSLLEAAPEARVVATGAAPNRLRFDFDDFSLEKDYSVKKAVTNGMSALLLYVLDLAKRHQGRNLTANFMHPGLVDTGLFEHMPWVVRVFMRTVGMPPEKGADTLVYLASSPDVKGITGAYFYKRKRRDFTGMLQDRASQERVRALGLRLTGGAPS